MNGFLTILLPKQDPNNGKNIHTDFEEETLMRSLFLDKELAVTKGY